MKKLLFLLLMLPVVYAGAQTQRIAYKSHSGAMPYYEVTDNEHVGLYIPTILPDSIIYLSDTSVLEFISPAKINRRYGSYYKSVDTIFKRFAQSNFYRNEYFDTLVSKDSLSKLHPGAVLIGFDKKEIKRVEPKKQSWFRKKNEKGVLPLNNDGNNNGGNGGTAGYSPLTGVALILLFVVAVISCACILGAALYRELKRNSAVT